MAMKLEQKQEIVAEVNQAANSALSAVVSDYRGLTVSQMTQLRAKARESGVYLKVIRNTLARRAVAGTEFECLKPALVGPLVLGFSLEDPGSVGRLFKDFVKANEVMVVKAVAVGGTLYGAKDLDRLATLPTKDQAISMLMSTMKAPVGKFVRTLAEPTAKFVRTVKAVADKQGA